MAYEPLHHKYRPQTFAELVGQDAITTTLTNALQQQKIAPAYLFTGARGTGKTSSARILAKSLNCLQVNQPTASPCGVCEVCRTIANGSALDVIEIDAASNTGVDNIRELIERAQFAPVQCRYKVYVIDECLTGDSLVLTTEGWMRIDDRAILGKQVLSYSDRTESWEFKRVQRWFDQGRRQTYVIRTSQREIRCTGNHLIRTQQGWIKAANLTPGMQILSPQRCSIGQQNDTSNLNLYDRFVDAVAAKGWKSQPLPAEPALPTFSVIGNNIPTARITTKSYHRRSAWPHWSQSGQTEPTVLDAGLATYSTMQFPQWHTSLEKVESVHLAGVEPVYDIEVEDNHNFVANGLLVHNCHMLSNQAFNALLKTLEEPPDRVVFVLATTDPQRVLPTIISRCQRFDFRRIELAAMTRHLTKIADQEAIEISPEAVQLVAQLAQGGLRDAESTLDQLSLLDGQIVPERVWDLVGAVPERDLLTLVQTLAVGDSTGVIDGLRALMDRGREPLIVLQNLASFYRDLLIAKTTPERSDLVAVTAPTWAEMVNFVQSLSVSSLLKGQQQLRASELQIKNTTQPRLWLEVTLLGLLSPEASIQQPVSLPVSPVVRAAPTVPISKVTAPLVVPSNGLSAPKAQNSGGLSESPLAQSSPIEQELGDEADSADATVEQLPEISALPTAIAVPTASIVAEPNLEQIWFSILGLIHPPGTRELFKQQGRLLALEPDMARVGITSQPLFKMAQMRVANLEAAFAQLQEHPVKVSLEVVAALATSPAVSSPMERSSSPPAGKAQAFSNGSNGTVSEASIAYKPEPPTPKPSPVSQPQASSPPQDSPADAPAQWQAEDAVSRAAKSFAQMFNGQIVSGTDPEPSPSDVVILDLEPEVGDPDDDVPF